MGYVVFRVDSSTQIGTGHVRRCLVLADFFKEKGHKVIFITQPLDGNISDAVIDNGFPIISLKDTVAQSSHRVLNSGSSEHIDAETKNINTKYCQSINILQKIRPEYVVLDHYQIGHEWEKEAKKYCRKLVVIDDLANRKHYCDVLIDQTIGRMPYDYKGLVSNNAKLLCGIDYALIRREFYEWREYCIRNRKSDNIRNILIMMGGSDNDNLTLNILRELEKYQAIKNKVVKVALGHTSKHIESIKNERRNLGFQYELLIGPKNIAELMAKADLAIGASGSTCWERCILGLPSIIVIAAPNQQYIAQQMKERRLALVVTNLSTISFMLDKIAEIYQEISSNCFKVTTNLFSCRVVDVL